MNFLEGKPLDVYFRKKISLTKMNIVGIYSQSGRKKFGYV